MEFEFNFGQQTLAKGVKKNEKVYASVAGVALPLAEDELVFMNRETGKNHVMTHQVLHALSLCQTFKPIDQHVIAIGQNLPELSTQPQAIEQVSQFLINNELLIEDKDFLSNLSQGSQQQSIKSAGIVIRTCNRPKQLSRLLQSLLGYQAKHKVSFPVQIYDDSTSEKLENELEEICKSFKKDLTINFYGSRWQTQFIRMLKREFKQSSAVIDWLLAPKDDIFSAGRVWNFALLNNAGKKFLFFDDDYIFEPRVSKKETNKVNLNENTDLNVGFALNLSDIRESSKEYERDVLSQMLNSCGQTLGNWVSTNEYDFESIVGQNLIELQRINANSVIKSTGNGTWGSPRSNSNYWLYYLEGEQKQEFWKSREVYLDNIEASHLMHYSNDFEVLALTRFSPSAIDNSSMNPFAMPVNRVEDHFYNAISLFCYPNQVSLHFPFMMGHIQKSTRDRSSANHIANTPNFNKFMADYALTMLASTDAKDAGLRLKTLAKYVQGLADSSDKNIHNRLKEYLSKIRSDIVLSMQNQIEQSPDAPVYWQADVREIIEANGKAILQNDVPLLKGWDENMDEQQFVEFTREKLNQVAAAMDLWPDLWRFCQTDK